MSKEIIHATLVFIRRKDEVLLAMKKRGFGEGLWNGVGGKIDRGETVEQAAIRETQEEIEVLPKNLQQVAGLYFDFQGTEDQPDMNVTVFTASDWEGEPTETEEMKPQWFVESDIPYDEMWEDDRYWLSRVLGGELLKGTFVFTDENKLVRHELEEVESF